MTNYIRINKELYEELKDWTESQAFKDTCQHFNKPIYEEHMILECDPPIPITYYYADANLFKAWFPIRTENDSHRKDD